MSLFAAAAGILAAFVGMALPELAHADGGEQAHALTLVVSDELPPSPQRLLAQAEQALESARRDYAQSNFEGCIQRLRGSEATLQHALGVPPVDAILRVLRRVNLWLGLCAAVTERPARADRYFGRAAPLPGEAPNARVFPPPVMARYRRVVTDAQGRARCGAKVSASRVWLDGRRVVAGDEVTLGEHYLAWQLRDGRIGAARSSIDRACTIAPSGGKPRQISRSQAADARFLQRLGQQAGVERLAIVDRVGGSERRTIFDVARGSFVVAGAVRSAPAAPVKASVAPSPATAPAAEQPQVTSTPWYKRWWVWAIVGAVAVTAGAVTAAYLLRSTQYSIRF